MDSLVRLSFFSLIKVSGEEAQDFLHRQFINDLSALKSQQFQHNAWCNRQGQVICNFFIARTGKVWWILLPAELASLFLERLQRFVLRSKLVLHPADPELSVIGLCGADMPAQFARLFGTDIVAQGHVIQGGDIMLWHLFGGTARYLLMGKSSVLHSLVEEVLAANCSELDDAAWSLLDISDNMPWITMATSELFLPQYLSLDLQQAMSFNKGCYPGQEVIARLHYRGKVKYRLKALFLKQAVTVSAGHPIIADTRKVGTVVNAATEKARTIMLAVCPVSHIDAPLMLQDLNLPLHDLPYIN